MYSKVIQLFNIYIYLFFFKIFSHLGYYRELSIVPCARYKLPLDYIYQDLISKEGPIPRSQGLGLQHIFYLGGTQFDSHQAMLKQI